MKDKIELPMCNHPELYPTMWDQPKPEPARTIGSCPLHDYICPVCGFGVGCAPSCDCNASVGPEEQTSEPLFGTHIREAIRAFKG